MEFKLVKYPEWQLIPQENVYMAECIPCPQSKNKDKQDMFVPVPLYKKFINPVVLDEIDEPEYDDYMENEYAYIDEYSYYLHND